MKKIWLFLKHHLREDFHLIHYLSIGILLAVLITFNYSLDFEDGYLDNLKGFTKFLNFLLLYAIAFFGSVWLYTLFQKRKDIFNNRWFWIKSLVGLSLLALDSSVPFLQFMVEYLFPTRIFYWAYKVSVNMISFFTVFIPIIAYYVLFEKEDKDIYGLRPKHFDARPYFIMLLIMLPMLIAASTTAAFLRQYPMYKTTSAHTYLGVDEWVTVAGYEIAYGLDFITVEFLFRGFFVLAFANILGRGAVLSMAVVYCTLHFGKPMGEAISSIFGGFLLGVVAFETRSIWGGVIVHMGIAWMMELLAFIQKSQH
jgi:hypothetical protein